MPTEAWNKMEAIATEMTLKKLERERAITEKLERIRKHNRDHPITKSEPIGQQIINDEEEIEFQTNPIDTNSAYYVLTYLFPVKNHKRKKKQ